MSGEQVPSSALPICLKQFVGIEKGLCPKPPQGRKPKGPDTRSWSAGEPGFVASPERRWKPDIITEATVNRFLPTQEEFILAHIILILWCPEAIYPDLRGTIRCPECNSADHVSLSGWTDSCRRVRARYQVYYVYARQYKCSSCQSGRASDPFCSYHLLNVVCTMSHVASGAVSPCRWRLRRSWFPIMVFWTMLYGSCSQQCCEPLQVTIEEKLFPYHGLWNNGQHIPPW